MDIYKECKLKIFLCSFDFRGPEAFKHIFENTVNAVVATNVETIELSVITAAARGGRQRTQSAGLQQLKFHIYPVV